MQYLVSLHYNQIVREVFLVDTQSPEEAKAKAIAGDGEYQYNEVTSGELISDATEVEEV